MNYISDIQLVRLEQLVISDIESATFPRPIDEEKEEEFTKRVFLPHLQSSVEAIGAKFLFLRSDGGVSPLATYWQGMAFYPDATITAFSDKLIAFEIKFLRAGDPGGSLSKAIGQSILYKMGGFERSYSLIFDLRGRFVPMDRFVLKESQSIRENVELRLFSLAST